MAKAKAVQPFVERIITVAKAGTFTARRRLESMINDRKIYAWVADPNVGERHKTSRFFELPTSDEIEFNRYGDVRAAQLGELGDVIERLPWAPPIILAGDLNTPAGRGGGVPGVPARLAGPGA